MHTITHLEIEVGIYMVKCFLSQFALDLFDNLRYILPISARLLSAHTEFLFYVRNTML